MQTAQPEAHPVRDLFANTIAAVLQTTASGIVGALVGGIVNWFNAKAAQQSGQNAYASNYGGAYPNSGYGTGTYSSGSSYPSSSYPSNQYPATAGTYPNSTYPSSSPGYADPNANAYPQTPYPTSSNPNAAYPSSSYPSNPYPSNQYPATASTYPSSTYPSNSDPNAYPQNQYPQQSPYPNSGYAQGGYPQDGQMVAARETGVYAGIAFEVHALSSDGHWTPVDTNTYTFRTGDRFMVYYRPSLPGRMQIYNINASGQQSQIDATDMAAGQLAGLGPYEFTNQAGDESLRLILSPCSTPQLLVATRDIVRVDTPPPTYADTGGGIHLSNCSVVATRGLVQTRGINDVAVDGLTKFALDAVSTRELSSGDVEPRQVTIVFHHR